MIEVRFSQAWPGINLEVEFTAASGATCLFGSSGTGKTSTMQAIAGLFCPQHARISIGDTLVVDTPSGVWVPPSRRWVGYVFQEGRLFPHVSVEANLHYGRISRGFAPDRVEFGAMVKLLGLQGLLGRRPQALSGGEKQRVAIGRALLSRPKVLLLDEPLAALDAQRKEEILPYLQRLIEDTAIPVLYVTHSVSEARHIATRVVHFVDGRASGTRPIAAIATETAV